MNSKTKDRHIVFITDDNYVMPTNVVIHSIAHNLDVNDEHEYIIHICTFGINSENTKLLEGLSLDKVKVVVHTMSKENYTEKFSKINQSTHVTPTALLKFDLSILFPEIDELLYLDSDIIVNHSISSLFDYDITNYYVAASFELWKYLHEVYKFAKETSEPDFYFNSGVLLMNLQKMRDDNLSDKLWESKFEKFNDINRKSKMMDQDALNDVCSACCLHLPIKYNCNCYFTKNTDISLVNKVYGTEYNTCSELDEDAVIIHYVGNPDKPWKYTQGNCVDKWDYYYNLAGYDSTKLERTSYTAGLNYKLKRFAASVKERGIINTFKYILYKKGVRK